MATLNCSFAGFFQQLLIFELLVDYRNNIFGLFTTFIDGNSQKIAGNDDDWQDWIRKLLGLNSDLLNNFS